MVEMTQDEIGKIVNSVKIGQDLKVTHKDGHGTIGSFEGKVSEKHYYEDGKPEMVCFWDSRFNVHYTKCNKSEWFIARGFRDFSARIKEVKIIQ